MKNTFGGFISTLDMAEERISELEAVSIKSSKTKKQSKDIKKKKKTYCAK